jgi:hypothetical protein
MTTPNTQQPPHFNAEIYEAQVREADARLNALKAKAEAKKAKADIDEISGLTIAKEQVRADIAELKTFTAADVAQTRKDFEQVKKNADRKLKDLQVKIDRASDRFTAWDDARERRFNARLDEADAKVRAWKASADQQHARDVRETRDDLATLEEKVALARASAAEARRDRYDAKSQEALDDAARHFDQAYDAAAKRYEAT